VVDIVVLLIVRAGCASVRSLVLDDLDDVGQETVTGRDLRPRPISAG
jgi:hypothetical protein